jgi:hypothetical protein
MAMTLVPHDRYDHGAPSRTDVALQVDYLLPGPQHRLSAAEFLSKLREMKAARLARPSAAQEPSVPRSETTDDSSSSDRHLGRYRIWYRRWGVTALERDAEDERRAADLALEYCRDNSTEAIMYSVDSIQDMEAEADRLKKLHGKMAARATVSGSSGTEPAVAEGDFFRELKKRRDELRAERERQS